MTSRISKRTSVTRRESGYFEEVSGVPCDLFSIYILFTTVGRDMVHWYVSLSAGSGSHYSAGYAPPSPTDGHPARGIYALF